jgi:hypothetical protein
LVVPGWSFDSSNRSLATLLNLFSGSFRLASAFSGQNTLMTKENPTPKAAKAAITETTPEQDSGSYIRIPKKLALGVGVGAAALGLIIGTSAISFAIAEQSQDSDRFVAIPAPGQDVTEAEQAPVDLEQAPVEADDPAGSNITTNTSGESVTTNPAEPTPGVVAAVPNSTGNSIFRSSDKTGTIAEFVAARDAGIKAAGGGSAVSIDRDSRGWEVYVYTSRGEVEVRLNESLAVIAIDEPDADDRNEPAPQTVLNGNIVNSAIAAAIAAGGSGAATDVEAADWDDRPGYTVTLVLANGVELDVYLDPNLKVTSTQVDD